VAIRDAIFNDDARVNRLLDEWWEAADTYIDSDKNDCLSADEYRTFHAHLMQIMEEDDDVGGSSSNSGGGDGELGEELGSSGGLSAAEQHAIMEADFRADAGEDGSVDREEFRFAVFQMADH
jgi:hypothetical protein